MKIVRRDDGCLWATEGSCRNDYNLTGIAQDVKAKATPEDEIEFAILANFDSGCVEGDILKMKEEVLNELGRIAT
jgi:hypothetical protein